MEEEVLYWFNMDLCIWQSGGSGSQSWWSSFILIFNIQLKAMGSLWRVQGAMLLIFAILLIFLSINQKVWWLISHWVDCKIIFNENITLIENIVKDVKVKYFLLDKFRYSTYPDCFQ